MLTKQAIKLDKSIKQSIEKRRLFFWLVYLQKYHEVFIFLWNFRRSLTLVKFLKFSFSFTVSSVDKTVLNIPPFEYSFPVGLLSDGGNAAASA